MTLDEIKAVVDKGERRVFWSTKAYEVIKDTIGQYLIKCHINNTYIGLTWADGTTLNGKPEDFFTEPK